MLVALATKYLGTVVGSLVLKLVQYGAIALAVLGLFMYIRKGGADAQKAYELGKAIDIIKDRRKIERDLKSAPDNELDKWL